MSMIKISPSFQNAEERNIIAVAIGSTLLFAGYLSFVPPLVVYFGFPDKLSDSGKQILRQFLNFMINVAVIMFALTFSVIGLPLVPLVAVVSAVFVIIILLGVLNNSEISIPVLFEALKNSSVIEKPQIEDKKEE